MLRVVSVGEEEDAPIPVSDIRPFWLLLLLLSVFPGENCYPPRRAATLEDRAVRLLIHFPPVLDVPCVVHFLQGLEVEILGEDSRHHCRI